jgi:hypothetical protein
VKRQLQPARSKGLMFCAATAMLTALAALQKPAAALAASKNE